MEICAARGCLTLVVVLGLVVPAAGAPFQGRKVNGPLAQGVVGDVHDHVLSPDGTRAVFAASQAGVGERDIFSAPTTGGPAVKLTTQTFNLFSGVTFQVTPDSTRVLYQRFGLFSVPIDGGPTTRLDPGPGNAIIRTFTIAPDGSRAVYWLQPASGSPAFLYSVPVAGGAVAALETSSPVFTYRISADSSRVVYQKDASRSLHSVPIGGGTPVTLLSSPTGAREWVISPGSTRVVYVADQDASGVYELYGVSITGGPAVKLNGPLVPGGDVGILNEGVPMKVSPDSSRVVYLADQDTDGVLELYSVPLAGGAATKLNGPMVAGGDVVDGGFVISPDSTRVVYVADQEVDDRFELYSVPLAGGPVVKLNGPMVAGGDVLASNTIALLHISPDSSRVVYRADELLDGDFQLLSVPLAGGPRVSLSGALPPGRVLGTPISISADSGRVAYMLGNAQPFDGFELYAVPLAGGAQVRLDAPLVTSSSVVDFWITADRAVYRGDMDLTDVDELYGVPLAGGITTKLNPRLATDGIAGDVTDFAFSDDGEFAVYHADQEDDDVFELYAARVVGGAPWRVNAELARGGDVASFALAGHLVTYVADQDEDETFELFGRSLDTGNLFHLSGPLVPGGDVTHAIPSPTGTRIVYRADQDTDDVFELYSTNGGPPVKLHADLLPGQTVHEWFVLSPEGRAVFLVGGSPAPGTHLHSASLGGGPSTLLSALTGNFREVQSFRLAPEGEWVAYVADQEADNRMELYRVPVQGGAVTKLNGMLVIGGDVLDFEIGRTGQFVVYRATQDSTTALELYAVPAAGGSPVKLNGPLVAGGHVWSFTIAPDETRVVYRASQESTGTQEIYVVPIQGGVPLKLGDAVLSPTHPITADSSRVVFSDGNLVSARLDGTGGLTLAGANTSSFQLVPGSNRVLFGALPSTNPPVVELAQVPVTGGPVDRIGGPLVSNGQLTFPPQVRGNFVLYRAEQDEPDVAELYLAFLERPLRRAR